LAEILFGSAALFSQPIILLYTDKKENIIFLIYEEIQMGAVAKSFMRKGFLLYEEMHKYLVIYEEDFGHI
jgi:hypothetical protein